MQADVADHYQTALLVPSERYPYRVLRIEGVVFADVLVELVGVTYQRSYPPRRHTITPSFT